MKTFKILISVVLFLSALVSPFGLVKVWEKLIYVGLIVPLLFQKIWFGGKLKLKYDKKNLQNILFSILFIIASVFALDIFILMQNIIDSYPTGGTYISSALAFAFNRLFFFYTMLYLWNEAYFKQKNKIFQYTFHVLKIFYIFIFMLVALWGLIILGASIFDLVFNLNFMP